MNAPRPLALHEPLLAGREWDYVKECLDTGWVSSAGAFVERFERALEDATGAKHAVAVVNGTAGLQLAYEIAGVCPGDEVLMPSLTFISTANAAVHLGAVPRFLDIETSTLGLDPEELERFLEADCVSGGDGALRARDTGARIAACVPMHALGHPARIDRIVEICAASGVPVVEDAAEALGSTYRGRSAGTFGRLGVLSFNGNKIATTGGGGAVLTDDPETARMVRHLSTQAKTDKHANWHDAAGYNYRLPNINAALGCAQLERLDETLRAKRAIAGWYQELLGEHPAVHMIGEPPQARSNWWLNTALVDDPERRDPALRALNTSGIGARPLWGPSHRQPPLSRFPRGQMTRTDAAWRSAISLPSSAFLTRADVERTAKTLLSALG
ncbi:MAG: hypothetical protein AUJ52_12510 [Elusimicrobia bacterium CG1_02_63_36]|nr:MAG: hypothetical protein AUJ52_12510 [Elusimicrobia bacterium CG1_02_63_36]PIP83016.1 MAG: aminotransferase DegT [Elusimicrobia bacterium CG22_combo_CG10-13_8_21_14_all_63_91]PJA17509.1 MAG: aminotransferase DegT [Elusimicrobia bacterium CG_4_10_14_0_2_um_filter_63_34]PJB25418.1 MAG: aminotransferase DegT [Elusimicrobia bacterium CG_4_9_14_3_um_filter_62_55]